MLREIYTFQYIDIYYIYDILSYMKKYIIILAIILAGTQPAFASKAIPVTSSEDMGFSAFVTSLRNREVVDTLPEGHIAFNENQGIIETHIEQAGRYNETPIILQEASIFSTSLQTGWYWVIALLFILLIMIIAWFGWRKGPNSDDYYRYRAYKQALRQEYKASQYIR